MIFVEEMEITTRKRQENSKWWTAIFEFNAEFIARNHGHILDDIY